MYVLYFFLKRVETGKTVDLVECIYTSGATLFLMATTAASTTTIHIRVGQKSKKVQAKKTREIVMYTIHINK